MTLATATSLALDRISDEFAVWLAVPEADRSPAPAHWWSLALALANRPDIAAADASTGFGRTGQTTLHEVSDILIAAMAKQTRLPWPGEFPRRYTPRPVEAPIAEAPSAEAAAQAMSVAVTPIA